MPNVINHHIDNLARLPSPLAGLALAIASLGWTWEQVFPQMNGAGQSISALLAALLIAPLTIKWLFHSQILIDELKHPIIGSVLPTYTMALMVISNSIETFNHEVGVALWLFAIGLHLIFLSLFIFYRIKSFHIEQLTPSWFIPPVGIIVAAVSYPGEYQLLAITLLYFGLLSYLLMLPIVLYRLILHAELPEAARPTIAILAAPASLSLAGYLTVIPNPSIIIVSSLLSLGLLMTTLIYLTLIHVSRLTFSPSFSSLTFPLVISAAAIFKAVNCLNEFNVEPELTSALYIVGHVELLIATCVVIAVSIKYKTLLQTQLTHAEGS